MTKSYRLACPIARSLDVVGDRWTLLVLRDLHAGPVRFNDLQRGLTGIASNMLSDRLRVLAEQGLVLRSDDQPVTYRLTAQGRATAPILFELARLGASLPAGPAEGGGGPKPPGNLRHLAVVLEHGAGEVVPADLDLVAGLVLDSEPLVLTARQGRVRVRYGEPVDPDVVIASSYDALLAAIEGRLSAQELASEHVELIEGSVERQAELRQLIWGALGRLLPKT